MAATDTLHSALQALREDPDRLIAIILDQAQVIAELRTELEQARARIDDLETRLDEAQRAAHRSAAPHRIDPAKRTKQPKRPGRRPGHAPAYRQRPDHIDETIEVPLAACPHCGRSLDEVDLVEQFIEELPPMRPQVTHLKTYRGCCAHCGPVASTHPLQPSQATGAAAVQVGPQAQALIAELIYDFGLTRRKVSRLLGQCFGLKLSPGGVQQVAHRLAARLRPRYERLKQALRQAPVVHADETSWYVGTAGGEPRAWLWVFCHPAATLYRVERSRGRAIITATLGGDFPGVLVSDCLNIYDTATPVQHKCYSHHLRAIGQALRGAAEAGYATAWLRAVRALLKAALGLKAASAELSQAQYGHYCAQLEQRADALLAGAGCSPWEQAVRLRLSKQRDHLFTFLYHEAVEATNNLAERQLRPAVITRKVMCGNRSERGAATWQVLASLAATARQQGTSLAHWIAEAFQRPPHPCPTR